MTETKRVLNVVLVLSLVFGVVALGWNQWQAQASAFADVPVRVGPEFLVNATNTFSDQWHPSVAPLPNGGAVIVWAGPDEVRGQRLDANGIPIGTTFRVGDADNLEPVLVATSPTGAFVVAWQHKVNSGGNIVVSIQARRYDSNANPLGGAFQVNSATLDATHGQVAVVILPGGFVVAWQGRGDGSGYGIFARRYDANGAAVGPQFRMNTTTAGNQARPSVAPRSGGGFTVVWESGGQDGSGFGIYGQHFDTSANKVGTEFLVNTEAAGHQARPRIASGPNGAMVVVWQSEGQDGDDWGIYGQRYDVAGSQVGGEFRVNGTTAGIQQRPAVAFDATGDLMVAWENYYQPGELAGNMKDVFAQRYDGNGAPVGSEVRVNTHIADFQDWAAVTGAANADFLVVWNSNAQDGSGFGIYAQRFGSATEPLPSPTPIPDGAIVIEQVRHTLKHNAQFNLGICTYCNCPSSCQWQGQGAPGQENRDENESQSLGDPYLGFPFPATTQHWGSDALRIGSRRGQSGAGTTTLPVQAVMPGEPFPLLHFTHMNIPIRGDSPTSMRIATAVALRPVGEPAFELSLGIPLNFLETDNGPPCDPSIQRSGVPCDDRFRIEGQPSAEITANGRIWKVQILGYRDPSSGAIVSTFVTQEAIESTTEIVAVLTVRPVATPTPTPTPSPTPTPVCPTITVNPPSLVNGLTFVSYSQTLTATGGTGSYTFSLVSGTLPPGLTLNGNVLSGTPTAAGASTFTIRASDTSNSCFGERTYTINIGSTGLMYYPLARPVRLLDTRPGASPNACFQPNGPITGGTSRTQPGRGTCEGLTIPANATTITGHITTVQSGGGSLTLYPSDVPQPQVTSSHYLANEILNNAFTVGLGASDGAFKIFVSSNTDLVVDVTGYYAPPSAGGLYFHPLPKPIRLLETRQGSPGCQVTGTPLQGANTRTQSGITTCDGVTIPTGALALIGNATTTNSTGSGYLTLYPADAAQPFSSSSNFAAGINRNAPFTVGLSPSGEFNIYTAQTTDLVIDVIGYFSTQASDANGQGLLFNSLGSPLRLLDTRAGQTACYTPGTPMTGGTVYTQDTQIACTNLTAAARALVGNVSALNATSNGYLTFWPSNAIQPTVATSNYQTGRTFNRHFTVGLGTDAAFKRFASSTTDVIIDISGFFAP